MAVTLIAGAVKLFVGLAGDAKPTGVPVGSRYLAYDTGAVFATYDGTNWAQVNTIASSAQLPTALAAGGGLKVEGVAGGVAVPTSDAGPSQAVTRTPFSSADCSATPVDLTTAPGASLKAVAMDIFFSCATACNVTILTESGGALLGPFAVAAGVPVQITLRGYLKGATVNKKLQMTTSVTSAVAGLCIWWGEA